MAPVASSLNRSAGVQAATNQVTVRLSNDGHFDVYNQSGKVDVVISVVGYYVPSTSGAQGAKGDKGVAGVDAMEIVTAAGGHFSLSNPTFPHFTTHGLTFGPFTNRDQGGSMDDKTLAGVPLRDLAALTYTASFSATGPLAAPPYLRIFIDNNGDGYNFDSPGPDDHDVVFEPTAVPGSAGRMMKYDVVNGHGVRYDDDGGTVNQTWDEIVNAHGSDLIGFVSITGGYDGTPDLTGQVVNSLSYEAAGFAPHTVSFSDHS